jgi:hypothetical protein
MSLLTDAPDLATSLELDADAPRAARHLVGQVDSPPPDLRDALVLLTSELVTRAVQQSQPGSGYAIELSIWMVPELVRVELRTPGILSLPMQRSGPSYDLMLLRQVADRWSIETAQYPACMWFEIDRHRALDREDWGD